MTSDWLHPGLLYILGAALIPFLRNRVRQVYLLLIPLLALLYVVSMLFDSQPGSSHWQFQFIGLDLILGRVDKLSTLFALVFTTMSLIGSIYSLHLRATGEHVAAYL